MEQDENDLRSALIDSERIVIERPIFTQIDFDKGFQGGIRPKETPLEWTKHKLSKLQFSARCCGKFLTSFLPFLSIMKNYNIRQDLPADIVAGLTVGIMHIPQGMAYGQLSTLPPVYGLYVSFFPVIVYFFFGTSRHFSIGTFAVVSLMVGSVVDKGIDSLGLDFSSLTNSTGQNGSHWENATTPSAPDMSPEEVHARLLLAMSVTFAVGILQLGMGILHLGFVTVYLSDPLISGFTTGAACHVFTSQIKHIFGVKINRYSGTFKLIYSYRDFFQNILQTNSITLMMSIFCMMFLVLIKEIINNNPRLKPRMKMPIPVELIVVVLGTILSFFLKFNENYDVNIVGDIPVGIPPPKLQQFTYLSETFSQAVAIAIVSFAVSVSMAKILAKKHDYEVDSNQELLAYGLCNLISSFFSAFCPSASLSRSLVQEDVGGHTQVAGLVSSALLIVVLLLIGPYFKSLPNAVLASIIIVALKGMFMQFLDLRRLWHISLFDFAVWLVSFVATVLLDVDLGLLIGVGFALITVIFRSQRPYVCILGQVPNTDIYRDISVIRAAEEIPQVKIYRFDAPLYFANADHFKNTIYKMTVDPKVLKKLQRKAEKLKQKLAKQAEKEGNGVQTVGDVSLSLEGGASYDVQLREVTMDGRSNSLARTHIHTVIVDCSSMTYIDSVGVKILGQVVNELKEVDVQLYLAQCKASVREMFERTTFYRTAKKEWLFINIHDAVLQTVKENQNGTVPMVETSDGMNGSQVQQSSGDSDRNRSRC